MTLQYIIIYIYTLYILSACLKHVHTVAYNTRQGTESSSLRSPKMQLQSTNGLQTDTSPLVASAIHVPSRRSLPSFYWRLDVARQSVWITIHWARRVTLVLGLLPRPEWLHSSTDHLEATPAVIKIEHSSRCPASFCLRIRETVGLRILGSAKSPENETKGS